MLNRKSIKSLIQLVDSRHPLQNNDMQMAEWIKYNKLPCFCIATKVDQISRSKINKTCQDFERLLNIPVFPFCKSDNYYNKQITDKIYEIIIN